MYNLKIAIRNLRRNSLYSWINIVGLAVSVTAAIFILLWVQDEWTYNKSYSRADNIYLLYDHYTENGSEGYNEYLPAPLARTIQAELSEVAFATAFGYDWDMGYLEYNGAKFIGGQFVDFAFVDTSFFHIFDMEFIEGNPTHAFPDPNAVVLTEETAQALFGGEPALGKQVKGSDKKNYHVTAVVKKPPQNSELDFKALFSFERSPRKTWWGQYSNRTFILLHPQADPESVGEKMGQLHANHSKYYTNEFPYILQPIGKTHLYAPDGKETGMQHVRLFTIIAIALLTIACINYVNLVTARARKRGKEIGLRKLMGAGKRKLFVQMMSETALLFVIAMALATVLLFLLMPSYSIITGKEFLFSLFNPTIVFFYLICFLFIMVLAGVYPAIFLSSFNYIDIFKSQSPERKGKFSFRKLLIVLQFACSGALILTTIVINRQQYFMQTKKLGYEREHVFTIDIMTNPAIMQSYEALRQELLQQPGILGVAASQEDIMYIGNFADMQWDGMPENSSYSTAVMGVDRNLFSLLHIEFAEGVGFTNTPADSAALLVNETAVKRMGIENPLNTAIYVGGWGLKGKITGVVKDFHFKHLSETIEPLAIYLAKSYWTIYVKVAPGQIPQAMPAAEKIWNTYNSGYPFSYKFMDETFDSMYRKDTQTKRLFNAFALIAIFISCLGLFGLATYTAEQRTKEIGIRKLVGASMYNIITMLSKEFILLVGIALIISLPLAYYWLDKMLQDYAYHISIGWWMFVLTALITVVLTMLTVVWRAWKAATANPVNAIKTE